jgi:hypothetical protein
MFKVFFYSSLVVLSLALSNHKPTVARVNPNHATCVAKLRQIHKISNMELSLARELQQLANDLNGQNNITVTFEGRKKYLSPMILNMVKENCN